MSELPAKLQRVYPRTYSWHSEAWQHWQHCVRQGRVAHALLVYGSRGCGVYDFALKMACSLLCDNDDFVTDDKPCLECARCRLFLSGNHPDYLMIEAEHRQIKIEQVRAALDFLHLSKHYSRYRVVLFREVDKLNYAAANSLLKTLEEPPADSIIVMTCRQPSALTMTLRSRCQRIPLRTPSLSEATQWLVEQTACSAEHAQQRLRVSGMRPLTILDNTADNESQLQFNKQLEQWLLRDIATDEFVDNWHDKPPEQTQQWLLDYLHNTIHDTILGRVSAAAKPPIPPLGELLYWLYPRQIERYRLAKHTLNPRLLLEASLLEWRKAHGAH